MRRLAVVTLAVGITLGGCGGQNEHDRLVQQDRDARAQFKKDTAAVDKAERDAASAGIAAGAAGAADAKRWEANWCKLQVGMSQADARKAMGTPVESYPDQDQWNGFGDNLTAFYDSDLNVKTLQGDYEGCAEDRTTP